MRLLDDDTVKDKEGNDIKWQQIHYRGLKDGEIGLARADHRDEASGEVGEEEKSKQIDAWRDKHIFQGAARTLTLSDHRGVLLHLRGIPHAKPSWKPWDTPVEGIPRQFLRQSDKSYEVFLKATRKDINEDEEVVDTPGRSETE